MTVFLNEDQILDEDQNHHWGSNPQDLHPWVTLHSPNLLRHIHSVPSPHWQNTPLETKWLQFLKFVIKLWGKEYPAAINCIWFERGRQIFGLWISLAKETRADFAAFIIFDTEHILLVPVGHPLIVLHPLETFCVKDSFEGDVPQRKRRLSANRIEVDGQETAWRCLVFRQSWCSSFASESYWRRFCCFVTCSI